jgi:hypothetical protein
LKQRKELDARSLGLGLAGVNSPLFAKTFRMKAVSFKRLADGPAFLIFRDVYNTEIRTAFQALLEIMYKILHFTCDADGAVHTDATIRKANLFKNQIALAFVLLEEELPAMFFDIQLHVLIHLPHCILRWNHVRNFWCFASERFIGVIKQYCNSRNNPHAGMVHGYAQTTFVRRTMDSAAAERIMSRFREKKMTPSKRSASIGFEDLIIQRGARPGSAGFVANPLKHNSSKATSEIVQRFGDYLREQKRQNNEYARSVRACTQPPLSQLDDAKVRRMIRGVQINGRKWKRGDHCLWLNRSSIFCYGVVQEFLRWEEGNGMVWCVRVAVHAIVKEENRVLEVEGISHSEEYVFWQQLRYQCKTNPHGATTFSVRMLTTISDENCD